MGLFEMSTTPRPNIVFIVADDLGFADLGCYGGRDASFGSVSPVLDGLAAGGLRFTEGYSNAPVCSPTRFALMTMRYQYRLRLVTPAGSLSLGLRDGSTIRQVVAVSGRARSCYVGGPVSGLPKCR